MPLLTDEHIKNEAKSNLSAIYRLDDIEAPGFQLGLFKVFDFYKWKIHCKGETQKLWIDIGYYPSLSINEAREKFHGLVQLAANSTVDRAITGFMEEEEKIRETEKRRREESLLFIEEGVLEALTDSALFYPCSGNDLITPIRLFSPYVTDFWFVDRGYFSAGHQDTRDYRLDLPASQHPPLLHDDPHYRLRNTKITGPENAPRSQSDIVPCVLTETYTHLPSGRTIRIHKRRGYGFSAFRDEMRSIGVFFYRGDSAGEGGSGNLWLKKEHVHEVCSKLIDNGLMVLDGSDGSPMRRKPKGTYSPFWKWQTAEFASPAAIKRAVGHFMDDEGTLFECVGYAGKRHSQNTLMWRVSHFE
jgi:hypothetical protein